MIRLNRYKNRLISLKDGEQFCQKCRGKGVVPQSPMPHPPFSKSTQLVCDICFGDGKLDWVEKATGKMKTTMSGEDRDGTHTP